MFRQKQKSKILTATQEAVMQVQAKLEKSRQELALLKQKLAEYHTLQQKMADLPAETNAALDQLIADKTIPAQFKLRFSNPNIDGIPAFVDQQNNYRTRLKVVAAKELGIEITAESLEMIDIDETTIPGQYNCPIAHEALPEDPVILAASDSPTGRIYSCASITEYFAKTAFSSSFASVKKKRMTNGKVEVFMNDLNRYVNADELVVNDAVKAKFNTFVKYLEIKQHLAQKEERRLALLAEENRQDTFILYAPDSNSTLEYLGLSAADVPSRFLSPRLPIDNDDAPAVVMSFPVTIEGKRPGEKITLCFHELMRYQDSIVPAITEEQKELLVREKAKRKSDATRVYDAVMARLENEETYKKSVTAFIMANGMSLEEKRAALQAAPAERFRQIVDAKRTLASQFAAIDKLTLRDIGDTAVSELINPFTSLPLETLQVNNALLNEIDVYMTSSIVPKLADSKKQLEDTHQKLEQLSSETLCPAIDAMQQQCTAEFEELRAAEFKDDIAELGRKVEFYELTNVESGLSGYRYLHKGKSYCEVLKERRIHEAPATVVCQIPETGGYEIMTHPVRLDSGHVIDYNVLLEFWKPRSAFLGLFGGREDRTGINPYTGQPVLSMVYDIETKREIDIFMHTINEGLSDDAKIFEKVERITIVNYGKSQWGLTMGSGFRKKI